MSVTLKELFESAGYDFNDYDDLLDISCMLNEAEELSEEVEEKIEKNEEESYID